jgi:ECF sigma factor
MNEVTRILWEIEPGDPRVAEKLLRLVYDELRKLAAARPANERGDHTLSATTLVHAVYMRLVGVQLRACGSTIADFIGPARSGCRSSGATFDNMLGGRALRGGTSRSFRWVCCRCRRPLISSVYSPGKGLTSGE